MRCTARNSWCVLGASAVLTLAAGCANSGWSLKMEPRSTSIRFGVPGCRISVPMSHDDMLREAKSAGDLSPEHEQRWTELMSQWQPGDHLRIVDCASHGGQGLAAGYYFYAVTRGDIIVGRLDGAIIN